jgi:uncharacterized protein
VSDAVRRVGRGEYRSMPWRNGLGVTLEIARQPLTGPQFDWRLSLAELSASGPFSQYRGYRRCVTLVSGAGFRLDVQGQAPVVLDTPGTSARFAGDAAAMCRLLDGACTDLSLIVREPGEIVCATLIEVGAANQAALHPGAAQAVFCLQGRIGCGEVTREGAHAGEVQVNEVLEMYDTLLLAASTDSYALLPVEPAPAVVLLLKWRGAADSMEL